MTDFEKALARTLEHEGGYGNVTGDRGGETFCGISRKFNPTWEGWELIDSLKGRPGFVDLIEHDPTLRMMVKVFYRKIWELLGCDHFDSYEIAEVLFDTAVNSGSQRAVEILQQSLNLLNRDEKSWPDLAVDGIMGAKTLWSIEQAQPDWKYVVQLMKCLRVMHYIHIMVKYPDQEKFARGWLERV